MTLEQFQNKADGLINDFVGGASDEKKFRDGMLDLLIKVTEKSISAKTGDNELLNLYGKYAKCLPYADDYLMDLNGFIAAIKGYVK